MLHIFFSFNSLNIYSCKKSLNMKSPFFVVVILLPLTFGEEELDAPAGEDKACLKGRSFKDG